MPPRKFTCQSVVPNNGIKRVMLVEDEYRGKESQPDLLYMNTTRDLFQPGDVWEISFALVARAGTNGHRE